MTVLTRTPYKERPRRLTEARTDGYFFKVTDDEGNGEIENEDEEEEEEESVENNEQSQVKLSHTNPN